MTASTATASAALAWQTNLSDEQRGMVKFVADTCENQSSEEIVAWLEDLNWDMSVINVKLDRVTRGEENFQSGWHQPTRKKKKTKHSTSESTSTNATSQSKKQRNSVKATPPRESTKKPRKNDRKQTRDRQNEPKSTGGGRRSERKRGKKQSYQPQFREKEGSTALPIQSASGIVSGDSSYADRAKPDGGTSVQESQSSASTPSISSRTPSATQYARPFQPNQAEGGNYGTPHRKRERNGRRKPSSPSNEREEPHEPREHRSRAGAGWDRYNQYSHPDEIPPRHSAGRRGGRHVNGATRNKYNPNHYMNGNQSYPAQTYRPTTRPPDENSTRRRERHKQEPYQDGKLDSAVKQYVKMNGTARPEVYREIERKPNYPTATLDLTAVNSNTLSSQPHLTLQQSSERDELETLSDKSDRSTTNMPNTIRIAPAVTPTQPAFPFGGPFSSEFKQTLQPPAQSEREMSDLKPSAGPPVITKATLSIPSSTITDPTPKHANGPTRPPMPRVGSAGVSSFANEKSYPVRQAGGMDGRIMHREDIVSSEKRKGIVVLPKQVFHEVKDMEPSEYGFGRPTDDFGATETAMLPAQTVLFVRDLEGRMERDDEKFTGIIGIPHDIVSQAELELKTEEELVELFAQFVRPVVSIPSAPPQSATPVQPVVTERNPSPVVEEVPVSVQQQAPAQPPTQPEQNASVVGTPTTSSIKSGAATGSAGATTEKTDQFNGQTQSGPVVFGRQATQPRPHGQTFGNSTGSRGFERKTPDSHSPEQYTGPPVHNPTVGVQPQIPSDAHMNPPIVFNATTVQMNRMPSNGSAPYSPNMMAAQMGGTQPNMVFHAMPAGGSALMSSGFGMGAQNGQLGHPQQQVVPSGVPNMAQPAQHQGIPQVHHLHNTHFGGPSHPPQFQMPRQHSHSGMPHAHIPHGAHPPGHQGPMPGQFPMPMQEDDRYHMPGQMMQMDFHPRFQAPAPPPPPQHTQGGFMHQLPQGNMGMHPPGPPPNANGQLPPPQAAPQAAPAFNGHLPPPLGGGMGHGPPPGHFGHGPAAPMFPQPTAHPGPPMTQPPQQMIGHSMGPQHPPPMFDQQQQHYRSEFVPNSYTQNQPQQWAGSFDHQY